MSGGEVLAPPPSIEAQSPLFDLQKLERLLRRRYTAALNPNRRVSIRLDRLEFERAAMPNSPSAKKELRKNEKRRLHNRARRSMLRTAVKKVRSAVEANDQEAADKAFRVAVKKLDQAAAKNLIHKNAAARTKSRLSQAIKKAFATAN